jgi:DNA modification methylase
VGADFTMQVPIGEKSGEIEKEQSLLEMVAYRDIWGRGTDSYLHMMYERLTLMKELLSDKGVIYVHLGWQVSALVKSLLDDVFGLDKFQNEIIWKRQSAKSGSMLSPRDRSFHERQGKNLRRTLIENDGVMPMGLLKWCLDYAKNPKTPPPAGYSRR